MQSIIKLYGGQVTIIVEEKNRKGDKYHIYKHEDGTKIISVTEATGMVNKPRLLDWAIRVMRERLIDMRQTGAAITIPAIIEASNLHADIRQEAADKGKLIHSWCEQYIKYFLKENKTKPDMPEDEQVINGTLAFMKWERDHKVKWLAAERVVYSRAHDYAGRMDAKAMVDSKRCSVDFKSGKGVYNEHRYQVAGYQQADTEETGDKYTGDKWLLRFDKFTGEFEAHQYGEHEEDFKSFLAALQLKRRDNQLNPAKVKPKKPVLLNY